jgi:hypothetical protein
MTRDKIAVFKGRDEGRQFRFSFVQIGVMPEFEKERSLIYPGLG